MAAELFHVVGVESNTRRQILLKKSSQFQAVKLGVIGEGQVQWTLLNLEAAKQLRDELTRLIDDPA